MTPPDSQRPPGVAALGTATLAAFALMMLVSGLTQVTDPFIRNDDYPSYFLRADWAYQNTLQEGRWITYWWHLRGIETPAWLSYAVYTLGGALLAGAIALGVTRAHPLWLAALIAALMAISPPATLLSLWFNTLIPGIWLTALYAVLSLYLTPATSRWLLLVSIPLTLLCYSTHPLVLLLICLARADARRSLADYAATLAVFAVAFALGMALMYSLNWINHGVFGLEYSNWRQSNPARDLAGLVENLPLVTEFYLLMLTNLGFGSVVFGLANVGFFLLALGIIAFRRPGEAFYIATGLAAGLGLLTLLTLKDGVFIFFRATHFVWVAYAITLARACVILNAHSPKRAPLLATGIATVTALTAVLTVGYYKTLIPFQQETRRLAAALPDDATEIRLYGDFFNLPEVAEARVLDESGLRYRLMDLTGLPASYCNKTPEKCPGTPPFAMPPEGPETLIDTRGGVAYIRLPGPAR